jgi:YqjK-like protein
MSLSLTEIQRRRWELVERARAERVAVRALLDDHSNLFWLADRGLEIVKFLAARKGLLLVAALAFAVVQPRRAFRWALKAWGFFRLFRRISRAFA